MRATRSMTVKPGATANSAPERAELSTNTRASASEPASVRYIFQLAKKSLRIVLRFRHFQDFHEGSLVLIRTDQRRGEVRIREDLAGDRADVLAGDGLDLGELLFRRLQLALQQFLLG